MKRQLRACVFARPSNACIQVYGLKVSSRCDAKSIICSACSGASGVWNESRSLCVIIETLYRDHGLLKQIHGDGLDGGLSYCHVSSVTFTCTVYMYVISCR